MKNQYNILVPLFIGCLLLTGIFLLRIHVINDIEKNITKSIKRIVHNNTSLEKLRTKSIEALNQYTKCHKKMTGGKNDILSEMKISYELDKLEDMYAWFKLASNNAEPETDRLLLSNDEKCKTFVVQDNGVDSSLGSIHIVLKVFNRPNNWGLIGVLTYINAEWNSDKNLYDISKVIIDLYIPDSNFFSESKNS